MSRTKTIFDNIKNSHGKEVVVANNKRLAVECVGDASVYLSTDEGERRTIIQNVEHVPQLCANLLSVRQLTANGKSRIVVEC